MNRFLFSYLKKRAEAFYLRDFEETQNFAQMGMNNVSFFMDTSYFVQEDWGKYKKKAEKYIVINLNTNGKQFFYEICALAEDYQRKGYFVYYVPVCKSYDPDSFYYHCFLKAGLDSKQSQILDWEEDFESFLKVLANAEQVI